MHKSPDGGGLRWDQGGVVVDQQRVSSKEGASALVQLVAEG
jgi:hypothetical protein